MTQDQHDAVGPEIAASQGLSWSWHLDLDALLTALSEPAPWNSSRPSAVHPLSPVNRPNADQAEDRPAADRLATDRAGKVDPAEAEFAAYLDAVNAGRTSVVPLSVAAGRVAEMLPTSPDLAAWLACNPAQGMEDGALAGAASAYRRLAAWAQAGELAVVAQMASRSAADRNHGTDEDGDGRPGQIPADAYGQVSLALTLSQSGAEWLTNLAVDLQWRLAATGTALRE